MLSKIFPLISAMKMPCLAKSFNRSSTNLSKSNLEKLRRSNQAERGPGFSPLFCHGIRVFWPARPACLVFPDALRAAAGIRAVIAPSLAQNFRSNTMNPRWLRATLPPNTVATLMHDTHARHEP